MNTGKQDDPTISELWTRVEAISSFEEAYSLAKEILVLNGQHQSPADAIGEILISCLDVTRRLSYKDVVWGRSAIIDLLIPLCVQAPSESTNQYREVGHRCRILLRRWLEQYEGPARSELREEVLNILCRRSTSDPKKESIWTIAAVGYRSPAVYELLWNLADRNDEVGDAAFSGIAGLGVRTEDRERVLNQFRSRAMRRPQESLVFAAQELADASLIDLIAAQLERPDNADHFNLIGLSLLGRIANAKPDDRAVQDRVWAAVLKIEKFDARIAHQQINFNSSVLSQINTPDAVVDFIRWFVEDNQPDNLLHRRRYLAYLRLKEAVRPAHIEGLRDRRNETAVPILRTDACANSELIRQSGGPERMIKLGAWETLFSLGRVEALDWLGGAISIESDLGLAAEILGLATSFTVPILPKFVQTLIEDARDIQANEPAADLALRLAAIRFACSSASRAAFKSLTRFGLRHSGGVLIENVNAIAQVAIARIRTGDKNVASWLAEVSSCRHEFPHRTAAIAALRDCAVRQLLDIETLPALVAVAGEVELPDYVRSRAVEAIGYIPSPEAADEGRVLLLRRLVEEDSSEEVRVRAAEALIRLGRWTDVSQNVVALLHLAPGIDGWNVELPEERSPWEAALITLLFCEEPTAFLGAVCSLIRRASSYSAHEVLRQLVVNRPHFSNGIAGMTAGAIVDRIFASQTEASAETWIFEMLREISPERLKNEPWHERWARWLPDARVALADALSSGGLSASSGPSTSLLLLLLTDGVFAVRRSAARSLARVEPRLFEATCVGWSASIDVELRKRAAEMLSWLGDHTTDFERVFDRLASDIEPVVRPLAISSRAARTQRRWADEYLAVVCSVRGPENLDLLKAYNVGRGLAQFGEDYHARQLTDHLRRENLEPHVRFWLQQILKAIDTGWQAITREWPEPWLSFDGTIEELDGELYTGHQRFDVHFSLWRKPPVESGGVPRWGGACWSSTGEDLLSAAGETLEIRISKRRPAAAQISVHTAAGLAVLVGLNQYPDEGSPPPNEHS